MPPDIKKLLYGNEDNDPLNAGEQQEWDITLMENHPFPFIAAFMDSENEITLRLKRQKKAVWGKFEKYLFRMGHQ